MALTRAKKTLKVEALAKDLAGSTSAIVGTFAKLTVSQDFALRQKVREAGGRYRVLKNTLAARASVGTGIEGALQGLKGVSSVAYTSGDPVALAKALSAWVKDNAEFTFKLGIVEGKVITVEEVQSLATMPGKNEIFAKLLFLINAPAQRLVTVVNAASRDLAVVINQGVEQGRFAEGKAIAAPASEPVAVPVSAVVVDAAPVADASAPAAPEVEGQAAPTIEGAAVAGESLEPSSSLEPELPAAVEAAAVESPAEVEGGAGETVPGSGASSEAPEAVGATFEAEAAQHEAELSPAPAPAEGPAADGSEAESEPTLAEEAATESPVEG